MSYNDYVRSVESPDGRDNAMGSGAFGHYQFMPATAAALAARTAWGRGMTGDQVKLALADPTTGKARSDELMNLYTSDSRGALQKLGLPANNSSLLAMHRFGQAGGTSLLQAPGNMPVAQWVKSVNWGPGVSAEAVIRQNKLDRWADVDGLRKGFIGGDAGAAAPPVASAFAQAEPPPVPQAAPERPFAAPPPAFPTTDLAALFTAPAEKREAESRKRRQALFG